MPEKLQGQHIAITRPEEQAKNLADMIVQQGGSALLFPLIAVSPLENYKIFLQQLGTLHQQDWAIFISTNAVQFGMPRVLQALGHVPQSLRFAAIGPVTAAELKKFAIDDTLTPADRFDSESLLALPEMHDVAGKNVVIFRGAGGRDVLADTLRQRGAHVQFAECYRRTNPQTDTHLLDEHWHQHRLDAMVITSSEAMRNLLHMTENEAAGELPPWLRLTPLCVNHQRIAELALQKGLKVTVAPAPGDEAMLDCLIQVLSSEHDRNE